MKQRERIPTDPPVLPLVCPFSLFLAHIPPYVHILHPMCPFLPKSRATLQHSIGSRAIHRHDATEWHHSVQTCQVSWRKWVTQLPRDVMTQTSETTRFHPAIPPGTFWSLILTKKIVYNKEGKNSHPASLAPGLLQNLLFWLQSHLYSSHPTYIAPIPLFDLSYFTQFGLENSMFFQWHKGVVTSLCWDLVFWLRIRLYSSSPTYITPAPLL